MQQMLLMDYVGAKYANNLAMTGGLVRPGGKLLGYDRTGLY
jgi:hypothetical protein